MASNTKLGFALILLIMGAFVFVVYKKAHDPKLQQSVAGESESGGDSKTFGDGGEAFGTGNDSVPPPSAIARHDAHAPHNGGTDHPRGDAAHQTQDETWTADADPSKPKPLVQNEQTAFNNSEPKRIPRTDLRETVKESPAFGDELLAQNDPAPFDSDAPRAKKKTNAADPFPGDSARQQPGNVAPKKAEPVPLESKKRTADADSFDSAETFDSDAAPNKQPKQAAANDDFADPFTADKPASKGSKEEEPFGADLDDASGRAAPARRGHETVQREQPAPEQQDSFDSNADSFTGDSDPSQRPPAPIKPRAVDEGRHKNETHVQQPQPLRRDDFNADSRSAPQRVPPQDNFADDASSSFDDARPAQPRRVVREGEFADSPRQDVHPALAGEETYVVQAKDNFWSISRKKYGTARYFQLLAELNKDVAPDPQQLQPGTKIVTPSKEFLEAHHTEIVAGRTAARLVSAEENSARDGHAAEAGSFVNDDGEPRYRVGAEETLSDIAQRHLGRAARWIQIFELNRDKLSSPNDLQVGMELVLPADATGGQLVRAVHESR